MSRNFLEAIKNRRSIYSIGKQEVVSKDRIKEVVDEVILHTPSAFNSQNTRVVILFDKEHEKLWEITKEELRKIVKEEAFAETSDKIDSFKAGYGTVLYFEELDTVKGLQEKFALYKDNFPIWSIQSSGMNQFAIWTALEDEGLGASLQHYNELIEKEVKKTWELEDSWKLVAQMPFGNVVEKAGEKEYMPLEERIKVFE